MSNQTYTKYVLSENVMVKHLQNMYNSDDKYNYTVSLINFNSTAPTYKSYYNSIL